MTKVDVDLENEREAGREMATRASDAIRNFNKIYRDERSKKPSIYNIGDFVLIRNDRNKPGVNTKLKANYKGPYQIDKILGCNRYVVKDIPGFNITQKPLNTILSSDKLKP